MQQTSIHVGACYFSLSTIDSNILSSVLELETFKSLDVINLIGTFKHKSHDLFYLFCFI